MGTAGDLKARLKARLSRRSSSYSQSSAHSEAQASCSESCSESRLESRSRPRRDGSDRNIAPADQDDDDSYRNRHVSSSSYSSSTTRPTSLRAEQHVDNPGTVTSQGAAAADDDYSQTSETTATSSTAATASPIREEPAQLPASDGPGNDLRPSSPSPSSADTDTTARTNLQLPSINEHRSPADDNNNNENENEQSPPVTEELAVDDYRLGLPESTSHANFDYPALPRTSTGSSSPSRPLAPPRRQSLLPSRQDALIKTLLHAHHAHQHHDPESVAHAEALLPIDADMVTRKIWVKRAEASATLITINEDDLVDDVRDMILRKYTNSLGKQFDAPDLTLRICPREQRQERTLGPEEPMGRTLDAYYPGGQTVDEALIIDIPSRRTPRPSPRHVVPPHAVYIATDDARPSEAGEGYFPPVGSIPSPNLPVPVVAQVNGVPTHVANNGAHVAHGTQSHHSIAVLGTGQIPQIPSPGGTRSRAYRERPERPRLGRTHTSSPTIVNNAQSQPATASTHGFHHSRMQPPSRTHSNTSADQAGMPPEQAPVSSPSDPEHPQKIQRVSTPPPRVSSPRPASARPKKQKKNLDNPVLPPGMFNGGVPPINVLIVEDNPINLKLLEAFVKRLKVRWKTAMNGRDAVKKWKTGGFHLVLMDIQLPVMNGLDATREIRRLERVNSIGVFSSSAGGTAQPEIPDSAGELEEKDRLENRNMFKSPVIVVALTASSLQSDRHEALAAGCNDFLTKPVNFVWLERKVMEWGCMQALIDFDGWRQWKDFSQEDETEAAKKAAASKSKSKKNRLSMTTAAA